jgi:hypothetical protein
MFIYKDYYVQEQMRKVRMARAAHARLVKLSSNVRETSKRTCQDIVSPKYFVAAKETK